jgi:hypothetical protein
VDRNLIEEIEAPRAGINWPTHRSYRNPGRFYVDYGNDTRPGRERWYYAHDQGRLLGYDAEFYQFLGSFGPDGFVPASLPRGGDGRMRGQPTDRFLGELRYPTQTWKAFSPAYLAFPGGVYDVDFSRRTIRTLFTCPEGETVVRVNRLRDRRDKRSLVVIATDKSVHILTVAGVPVLTVPRAYDQPKYVITTVAWVQNPDRYILQYRPSHFLMPEEIRTMPSYVLEYDAAGHELSRRIAPRGPETPPSYAAVLFGLATPPAELAVLSGTLGYLRSEGLSSNNMDSWIHQVLLEEWTGNFLPWQAGLRPGFIALSLLSSAVGALVCYLMARRYAFSRGRRVGWSVAGLLFGPTGFLLMLVLEDWPARVSCPSCRRPRRVDRAGCERCGAPHAAPVADGTEIFELIAAPPQAALVTR